MLCVTVVFRYPLDRGAIDGSVAAARAVCVALGIALIVLFGVSVASIVYDSSFGA